MFLFSGGFQEASKVHAKQRVLSNGNPALFHSSNIIGESGEGKARRHKKAAACEQRLQCNLCVLSQVTVHALGRITNK